MNKISLYFLLILIYLGLSKSFAPSEQATSYIPNQHTLQHFFQEAPISVILTDSFKTGLIIHTYFQRYTIVYVFKPPEEVHVRTSQKFWTQHLDHIGMSILRRDEKTKEASTTPMPPGFLFVGDPAYGSWDYHNSGQKVWQFHNAYKSFPKLLGWADFLITQDLYQTGLLYLKNDRAFFGPNQEFGSNGKITQQVYDWSEPSERSFMSTLADFWSSVKDSLSLSSVPAKKVSPLQKKPLPATPNLRPEPTDIPLKKVKSQLGEQSPVKKNEDDKDSSTLPNIPLGEETHE